MKTVPLKSSSNPDDPRPWADLALTDGSLDVTVNALNGLVAFRQRNGLGAEAPPGWQKRPDPTSHSFSLTAGKEAETHVLAVTLDGTLVFVAESDQQSVYYAHLAWWEPASGEWTALDFIDG